MKFSKLMLAGVTLWSAFAVTSAKAEDRDEAFLDPAPKRIFGVRDNSLESLRFDSVLPAALLAKNDLTKALDRQTSVKSQGKRGTCSIFSATGILESILKVEEDQDFDLSENYLEYLVMAKMKSVASEGSDTDLNIPALASYGTVRENVWPYEEYDWTSADLPEDEAARAEEVCGELKGNNKQACLLGHMSPEEDLYAKQAKRFRADYSLRSLSYDVLQSQRDIKAELSVNNPLVLSVEFFYGAWNHRKMVEYGIGERDMDKWAAGEVGTPTSDDVRLSRKHPAGHSFVIVGFDDSKRVYYFKNSWGTAGFGVDSDLLGSGSSAGYGTITYDYAHKYGTFYGVSK